LPRRVDDRARGRKEERARADDLSADSLRVGEYLLSDRARSRRVERARAPDARSRCARSDGWR